MRFKRGGQPLSMGPALLVETYKDIRHRRLISPNP